MNIIQRIALVTGGVVIFCIIAVSAIMQIIQEMIEETQASINDAHEELHHNSFKTNSLPKN